MGGRHSCSVVGSVFCVEERTSVSRACMQRSFATVKEQRDFLVKYSRHDDLREYMARLWYGHCQLIREQ